MLYTKVSIIASLQHVYAMFLTCESGSGTFRAISCISRSRDHKVVMATSLKAIDCRELYRASLYTTHNQFLEEERKNKRYSFFLPPKLIMSSMRGRGRPGNEAIL